MKEGEKFVMDNRFYTIKGIATEFPPDNQFYIEMMDQKMLQEIS